MKDKLRENRITQIGLSSRIPICCMFETRYGQPQFENGGLLDDKKPFANGVEIRSEAKLIQRLGEEDYQLEMCN